MKGSITQTELENDLIKKFENLILWHLQPYYSWPDVEVEELKSAAMLGVWTAIKTFTPGRASLNTYVTSHIKWGISHSIRQQVGKLKKDGTIQRSWKRGFHLERVCLDLQLDEDTTLADILKCDNTPTPSETRENNDVMEYVSAAHKRGLISSEELRALHYYYILGYSSIAIGRFENKTGMAIRMRIVRALHKLRKHAAYAFC